MGKPQAINAPGIVDKKSNFSVGSTASPRTAAELGHVLVEGLRGELQPLDRGQIWEDRLAERLGGHGELERHGQCLDGVRPLRCSDLAAQQEVVSLST